MTTTPDVSGYYSGATGLTVTSSASNDIVILSQSSDLSNPITDEIFLVGQADFSSPLQDFTGNPVLLVGVDLSTGQRRPLNPGDAIARSDGTLPFGTGLDGFTGIYGITGSALQGERGTIGDTGIAGAQGIVGVTGIQGIIGTLGATGVIGTTGFLGATGIQGITGFFAEEGYRFFGATGLRGATGIPSEGPIIKGATGIAGVGPAIGGTTGLGGIPGNFISAQGFTGLQGVQGSTGILGVTGVGSTGATPELRTLSAELTPARSITSTIPGNTLSVNEQYIKFIAFGDFNDQVFNSINIVFGSTTIANLTELHFEDTKSCFITGHIFRNTATEALCFVEIIAGNNRKQVTRTVATETLANNLNLSIELSSGQLKALVIREAD